ncbi:MAG: hypothetical protein H6510_11315 [Acidobacteria bacterium]|nr:hypothetical protein [Acidobacteriota bacterium]
MIHEFGGGRTAFWLQIHYNSDGSLNLCVAPEIRPIVEFHFELSNLSPKKWEYRGKTNRIWIPADRVSEFDLKAFESWAEQTPKTSIWLKCGKHLKEHFRGDELEHCLAGDFNFSTVAGRVTDRTPLGEAEYQLKYQSAHLSDEARTKFLTLMGEKLLHLLTFLPLGPYRQKNLRVTTIPITEGSNPLATELAAFVAKEKGLDAFYPKLLHPKPQVKNLGIKEKLEAWIQIYSNTHALDLGVAEIKGRDIVIVDDLYQSGATLWTYAKALKTRGARSIFGLVCVKSMRDSDNQ